MNPRIRVVHYQRKSHHTFSIERVFDTVRKYLPAHIFAELWVCRFRSRGIVRRILNLVEAPFHQGDINHITGDVNYLALTLAKRKTILTIHDCGGLKYLKGMKLFAILWFWYRFPVRQVAAVTVISEFTRTEVLHNTRCPPEVVHVIHDPVPPGFFPCPKEFCVDRPVVLQVGTTEHNKNIGRLAEAIRGIRCHLDIIGRLSDRQRQALEQNSIIYSVRESLTDEEMIQRYRECDMVVLVSTYEGFGMPIIEANATGRPVVTSNIGPMPEVAGSAACLVDPFDCSSIREGVLRVMGNADYRNHLVAEGLENVKRFQAETIAAQYAKLYRNVLSGQR